MDAAIPAVNFGASDDFALGIEEELILVDPVTHALEHSAVEVLGRLDVPPEEGAVVPEAFAALVELVTPVSPDAGEAVSSLFGLRRHVHSVATTIGAGLHPNGAFGDVVHYPSERYRLIGTEMRGLMLRTPTAALHVHIGMPDADVAIRAYNGLRAHLPLLQALAANSPFWHGHDSGLATARAQVFRGLPRSEIPAAFGSFDEYVESVEALAAAGQLPDYTFLWWDIRLHPVLGTLEVRAMDCQSSLSDVAALAGLVHALTRRAAEEHGPWEHRDALMESSFRAARDGLDASLWYDGRLRPVPEIARATMQLAMPYARELGSDGALEELERMLVDGNGAVRRRAAFARGGMPMVLSELVEETAQPLRAAVGLGAAVDRP
ncbi:MAG TPA: YbdK family carboxylate-amine ligase [Gaiellaceae bacterium]|nr:YbdK family carboxylate-amine ligase [Gaiellaceae bacterium]